MEKKELAQIFVDLDETIFKEVFRIVKEILVDDDETAGKIASSAISEKIRPIWAAAIHKIGIESEIAEILEIPEKNIAETCEKFYKKLYGKIEVSC